MKNRILSVIVGIVAVLALSSCNDEDTFTTSLFCDFISDTDRNGYFESRDYYTFRDIHDIGRSSDVLEMGYLGTTVTFEGVVPGALMRGDVIRDVYIDVKGMDPFLYSTAIDVQFDNERIGFSTHDDPEFYDFMWEVMHRFYEKGNLDVMVYGRVTHNHVGVRDVRMRVTLDNLIDVTTLDYWD